MIHETNECQPQIWRGEAFKENEAAFCFSDGNRSDKLAGVFAHQLAITFSYKIGIIICYESETLRGPQQLGSHSHKLYKRFESGSTWGSTGQRKKNLI